MMEVSEDFIDFLVRIKACHCCIYKDWTCVNPDCRYGITKFIEEVGNEKKRFFNNGIS